MMFRICLSLIIAVASAFGAESTPAYAHELLDAHNVYRAKLGVPPLIWSSRLAKRSEEWALLLLREERFGPRRDGLFGENLFESSGGSSSPNQVVAGWMSEQRNYNESNNSCSARCGHFTQVVWRDTKAVGCGVAHNRTTEIWVCNYDPPGNMRGERPY